MGAVGEEWRENVEGDGEGEFRTSHGHAVSFPFVRDEQAGKRRRNPGATSPSSF